jgi:hypothetical protein
MRVYVVSTDGWLTPHAVYDTAEQAITAAKVAAYEWTEWACVTAFDTETGCKVDWLSWSFEATKMRHTPVAITLVSGDEQPVETTAYLTEEGFVIDGECPSRVNQAIREAILAGKRHGTFEVRAYGLTHTCSYSVGTKPKHPTNQE